MHCALSDELLTHIFKIGTQIRKPGQIMIRKKYHIKNPGNQYQRYSIAKNLNVSIKSKYEVGNVPKQ